MAVDDKAGTVVADSSPAIEEKSTTQILKDLTLKQMKAWRQTGDLPEDKSTVDDKKVEAKDSKSTDADSSTAAKKDVAAPDKKAEEPAKSAVADKTEPP